MTKKRSSEIFAEKRIFFGKSWDS